ncbi:MAG: MATE family efflux transporter [Cytophagales bacterium]|nr:MATE family efflux transporter [Bernardetiaceae bacterium]MDW8210355.1 MATE family efflux transporter [Cytophagales bacterium]
MLRQYLPQYRKIIALAYPIIIGQISHILIELSDSIMLGNHSSSALAAATFANAIFVTLVMLGIASTWVITPLVAAAHAAGNLAQCRRWLYHGLIIFSVEGMILGAFTLAISNYAHYFGQRPEVLALAVPYLQILGLSIAFVMVFQVVKQFMEGLGQTSQPMYINLIAAALNIIFNYLLIFGKLGFPELGIIGAGIASLVARFFATITILWRLWSLPDFAPYVHKLFSTRYHRYYALKLLQLGLPTGFQVVFESGAFAFASIIVGWLGVAQLAAHQVALNIATVTFAIAKGISSAGSICVAQGVGQKSPSTILQAAVATYHLGIAYMSICAIGIAVFRHELPSLYFQLDDVNAKPLMEIAAQLLIYVALFQVFDGAQVVGMGILRGIQDVKAPTVIALVSYLLVGLLVAYLLGFKLGMQVNGIWLGLALSLMCAAVLLAIRFFRKIKQMQLA